MNTNRDVWVLVEAEDDKISCQSAALLEEGERLASELNGALHALFLGPEIGRVAEDAGSRGAATLYACTDEKFRQYDPCRYEQVILNLLKERQPHLLLALSSSLGSDLLPRLAFKVQAPLVTHCADIDVQADGGLLFMRPVQKGRLFAKVRCKGEGMKMASFLPERLVASEEPKGDRPAEVVALKGALDTKFSEIRVKGFIKADHRTIDITEAEIIVAVGRGVGSKDAFSSVEKLADSIGGAIGGTRPMVDAGIIPYERQIGQTGKRVYPRLTILLGVSGATEFIQGIAGGGTTIAINIDRQSPVFKSADLGIVGDLEQLMPMIVKHVSDLTGSEKRV